MVDRLSSLGIPRNHVSVTLHEVEQQNWGLSGFPAAKSTSGSRWRSNTTGDRKYSLRAVNPHMIACVHTFFEIVTFFVAALLAEWHTILRSSRPQNYLPLHKRPRLGLYSALSVYLQKHKIMGNFLGQLILLTSQRLLPRHFKVLTFSPRRNTQLTHLMQLSVESWDYLPSPPPQQQPLPRQYFLRCPLAPESGNDMHAMQYRVTLPADYDMGIIRTRIEKKESGFDTFPGFDIKAFLIREAGVDGSPINE
jgi:Domain of unknown function (DUF4865)